MLPYWREEMKDEHTEVAWLCSDPSLQRMQGCTCTEMLIFLRCCLLIFKLRQPRRALQLSSSASLFVGPSLDQEGHLSAHGGEDALCFSAYLTWGQQRWTSRKERGWGESPSSAAFAVGLMSEGFTQLWGLLFGKTDCFSRDNGCAGAGAGSSGRHAHGHWMGPAAVQMEGSASKTKVKLLPAHCWKERGRTVCPGQHGSCPCGCRGVRELCSDIGSLRGRTQPSFQMGKMKAGLPAHSQPQKCQIPVGPGIALIPAQPLL